MRTKAVLLLSSQARDAASARMRLMHKRRPHGGAAQHECLQVASYQHVTHSDRRARAVRIRSAGTCTAAQTHKRAQLHACLLALVTMCCGKLTRNQRLAYRFCRNTRPEAMRARLQAADRCACSATIHTYCAHSLARASFDARGTHILALTSA